MFYKKIVMVALGIALYSNPVACDDTVRVLGIDEADNVLCLVEPANKELCELIQTFVETKIEEYNTAVLGELEREEFTVFVKTKCGAIVGGVSGAVCKKNSMQPGICALQYFWVDELGKSADVDHALINGLKNYLETKDCALVAYPSVWEEINYCRLFLDAGALVAKSGSGVAREDDGVGYVIRSMRCVDGKKALNENYEIIALEQIDDYFFEQMYAQTEDVLHCHLIIADVLSHDPYAVFITSKEGVVLGGAAGNIINYEDAEKSCCLEGVWVDQQHRGKKFGLAMASAFLQYAKDNGCKRATLGAFEWQGKEFFEKLGFTSMTKLSPQAIEQEECVSLVPYHMQKAL
jgi:GNAT superfamily N-acetyltransferase